MPPYYLATNCLMGFDEAVNRLTAALKEEGLSVVSNIDVQAILKSELGADIQKLRILGACDLSGAHKDLGPNSRIAPPLPCNLVVREETRRQTVVAAVDPLVSVERLGNPLLAVIAEEARLRLQRVLDDL